MDVVGKYLGELVIKGVVLVTVYAVGWVILMLITAHLQGEAMRENCRIAYPDKSEQECVDYVAMLLKTR